MKVKVSEKGKLRVASGVSRGKTKEDFKRTIRDKSNETLG